MARRRHQRQSFAEALRGHRPAATRKSRPMLDAMRRGAVNWLAKILLGLLIIAFAVWGVADVFRGYGRGTLARVGSTEISVDEYRQAYHDEMASISRRMGRRLTTEQAKLLGLEQRALSRLIGAAAIDTHARQLHLVAVRAGHRRADPPGPRLQGLRRRLLAAQLPELSAPERRFRGLLRQQPAQGGGARAADRHAAGRPRPAAAPGRPAAPLHARRRASSSTSRPTTTSSSRRLIPTRPSSRSTTSRTSASS